jgi:uncharacterized protein YndB with AHSA1/START domain
MSERKHEFEVRIDASTEEVWKAISEAAELTRWFAPDARVKPGPGGSVWLSWGPGMEGEAPITVWEPGRRLQTAEGAAGNPKTVDYFIESRDGATVLRLVHSGFGAEANFDDEYESTHGGWLTFLAMLRYGLERQRNRPHVNVTVCRFLDMPREEAWQRLLDGIGVGAALEEGKSYSAQLGETRLTGTVIRHPKTGYLCLSVAGWNDSLLSLFVEKWGGKCSLTLTAVLFGPATERASAVRQELEQLAGRLFSVPV